MAEERVAREEISLIIRRCNHVALVISVLALSDSLATLVAAERTAQMKQVVDLLAPAGVDVALQQDSLLRGILLDTRGNPLAKQRIWIGQDNGWKAQLTTDENGQFALTNMRGGFYRITTIRGFALIRAWSPGSAPPTARPALVLAEEGVIIRGQGGSPSITDGPLKRLNLLPVALTAGAGAALGLGQNDQNGQDAIRLSSGEGQVGGGVSTSPITFALKKTAS